MEISENERLMLVNKKEEIQKITSEILDIYQDSEMRIEIIKKLNHILELLSTIAGYSKPDRNIDSFTKLAVFISGTYGELLESSILRVHIEIFCATANSVQFKFTKSGLKLHIPKIDLSIIKL